MKCQQPVGFNILKDPGGIESYLPRVRRYAETRGLGMGLQHGGAQRRNGQGVTEPRVKTRFVAFYPEQIHSTTPRLFFYREFMEIFSPSRLSERTLIVPKRPFLR
ncbi:MAG: hypothetical protein ACI81P_000012 [Neolewinella sp.]|jgi:hypothetical protein